MAVALREKRPIRGVEAIAERPDGSRVPFIPYPTPLFDAEGRLTGGLNMLVDISARQEAERLRHVISSRFRGIFDTARVALWQQDFSDVSQLLEDIRAEGVSDLRAYLRDRPERLAEAVRRVRVNDVNPFAVELFEAGRKEALLASLSNIFLPETEPIFIEELVSLWEGRRRFESETAVRTLNGRRLDVAFTVAFEGERFERTLVSVLDISAQKNAERALREQAQQLLRSAQGEVEQRRLTEQAAQRLAAIVELSDDAILAKNLDGIITSWNRGAERLFGYMPDEVIGKPVTILIPLERHNEEPTILARIRRGERIDHYETVQAAQGRQSRRNLVVGLADQEPRWGNRRCIQDRPRHHRAAAGAAAPATAAQGDGPPRQESVFAGEQPGQPERPLGEDARDSWRRLSASGCEALARSHT